MAGKLGWARLTDIIILTTGLAPGLSAVDTDIVPSGDNDMESESIATRRVIENS